MHLGHYFSVIKPGQQGCTVLVANYHAPKENMVEKNVELLRKFGVSNIIFQTEAFDPKFYFELLGIVTVPELKRMPQFNKAVVSCKERYQTAHLLTYPVLMAHDIEGYQKVFVGEDQIPHIDFARTLLKRYGRLFGVETKCPEAVLAGTKIMDLRHPCEKMSKSTSEYEEGGCIYLDDSEEEIRHKVRKAVMTKPGEENMRVLYSEFVGEEMPGTFGIAKDKLADKLVEKFCSKEIING